MSDSGQAEDVRRGYDELSFRYRADDGDPAQYAPWLRRLRDELAPESRVLDLGCGCGIPVARDLTDAGHRVTGIDISGVQIERARQLVPGATFARADMTTVHVPPESMDAVVALYSIIHVPLEAQSALLQSIARWLVPGGLLLLSAGWLAWTGDDTGWLGGTTSMRWSQADVATYRRWLAEARFRIAGQEFVPEGDTGHPLFWARAQQRRG